MKKENGEIFRSALQDKCENLYIVLREHKEARHLTNQEVADAINVPVDRVRKFFAGELKNPNVFSVMAICIYFGLSLDTLLENPHGYTNGNDAQIVHLENENLILNLRLEHEKENTGRVERSLKRTTTFTYILLCLCAVMVVALVSYFVIDITHLDIGFVRETHIEPVGILVAAIILGGCAVIVAWVIGLIKDIKAQKQVKDKN